MPNHSSVFFFLSFLKTLTLVDVSHTDGRALKDKLRVLPNDYTRKGSDRRSASTMAGLPIAGSASRLSAVCVFFLLPCWPTNVVLSSSASFISPRLSAPRGSCSCVWTGQHSGNFPLCSPTVFAPARSPKGMFRTAALRRASEGPPVFTKGTCDALCGCCYFVQVAR